MNGNSVQQLRWAWVIAMLASACGTGQQMPTGAPDASAGRSSALTTGSCSFSFPGGGTASATQGPSSCPVMIGPGQTISLGTCAEGTGSADTYLRLLDPSGHEVASSDDAPGCGLLSHIVYAPSAPGLYAIRAGCYANTACSGTVGYQLFSPSTPHPQYNMLGNPGFDAASATGASPATWATNVGSGSATFGWDATQYVSANHSALITITAAGQADWRQYIPADTQSPRRIDPAAHYRLRGYIQASNVDPVSHAIELQWFDAANKYIGREQLSSTAAQRWVEVSREHLQPPPNAASAFVLLRAYKLGTYRFDDVVLTKEDQAVLSVGEGFPIALFDAPPKVELLRNPDLAFGGPSAANEPGEPVSWNRWIDSGSATLRWVAPDAAYPLTGTLAIDMTAAGQADWRQLVTSIDPSLPYHLSGEILASPLAPDPSHSAHAISLQWFDASGAYISRVDLASDVVNTWATREQGAIVPPANAASAWILLRAYAPGSYSFRHVSFGVDWSFAQRVADARSVGASILMTPDVTALPALASVQASAALATQGATAYPPDVMSDPDIALWVGQDEARWHQKDTTDPDWATDGRDCLDCDAASVASWREAMRAADPLKRPALLNHAPRGSYESLNDFSVLVPYVGAADVHAMDIYPVPVGYGHSSLDQEISCVGQYADRLYTVVSSALDAQGGVVPVGFQRTPTWMALQGAGWTDWSPSKGSGFEEHGIYVQWFSAGGQYLGEVKMASDRPNEWRYVFTQRMTPPPGTAYAWVLLRVSKAGIYDFDDLSVCQIGGACALLNGGAEEPAGGGPAAWIPTIDSGVATQSWASDRAHSGQRSLRVAMTSSSGQADWRQRVTIDPAKTYSFSGWIFAQVRPTREQTWFMAYDAIIHGARGLAYYGTEFLPVNSGLWRDIKALARELTSLSTPLASPVSHRLVSVTDTSIEALLLGSGDQLYLLAANHTGLPVTSGFVISGASLGTATRVTSGDSTAPVGLVFNGFSDQFAPYQVHVYRLSP